MLNRKIYRYLRNFFNNKETTLTASNIAKMF